MFWIALATAIMMLSGEGDDTRAIAALIASLRYHVVRYVPATPRRTQALDAITSFEHAFAAHRHRLQDFGKCVEAADRKYAATSRDYAICRDRMEAQRLELARTLEDVQHTYESALEPEERARIAQVVASQPEAWVLDPALESEVRDASARVRRFRGLEGVASERHLTLPRNVVAIKYGPIDPATFGQRYPSRIIDTGTSYLHQQWNAQGGTVTNADQWHTRFGVRFGLFDDLEAGAVFLPFELAPDFRFESVLVALTQQFRFKGLDLAARLSFQLPGQTGWALAPGVLVATHGPRLALQAGVLGPMELGSFRDPKSAKFGINVPARLVWNATPEYFLTAESGFAYDDFSRSDGYTIPLGFGTGYTWLVGSRLIEFTLLFSWDHFLLPATPDGASALQPGVFRIAAGASMSFQAL